MDWTSITNKDWLSFRLDAEELLRTEWEDLTYLQTLNMASLEEYCKPWWRLTTSLFDLLDFAEMKLISLNNHSQLTEAENLAMKIYPMVKDLHQVFHAVSWNDIKFVYKAVHPTYKDNSEIFAAKVKNGEESTQDVLLQYMREGLSSPDVLQQGRKILQRIVDTVKEADIGFSDHLDLAPDQKQGEAEQPAIIYIDMKQFNKGTGSFELLADLIKDIHRDGITLDTDRHGKKQPQSLRDILNSGGYEQVAKNVKTRKRKVILDIPIEQITTDPPKI